MNKYILHILFSEEDESYQAIVPELPGCAASGKTEEEALEKVKQAIEKWLQVAREEGRPIPEPHGKKFLADLYRDALPHFEKRSLEPAQ
ncbi:MAG: type II toxin-antitoxin system HicB family antitoxin [Theionarchaea archaeon]|nr:type II toxin-antitoxin system HicB family antitoxin [Theionarchaea archaeon]MBU7001459.1 type II toxin-antitoxin system HicB family antitoxin [Theionarchaea archaeon]MBU7022233.1 type II toxin-antitoxin system HicB family antitoxin [Theionarchaea archaeon]MBU7035115.1 type II toxin-antitoxin system HicB family antitoxin [Theionarchaea archaeon]MBU7040249.1 type II toxin-antitoxin system HicB family antitoxin [Theionarchaea archaeon]